MLISAHGLSVDLPEGWEARIFRLEGGEPTLHAANFPLPPSDGEFGGRALSGMGPGGMFVAVTEYRADVAGTPLFAAVDRLAPVTAGDLDPRALQRIRPGQQGGQRFATLASRPFCVYVVVAPLPGVAAPLDPVNLVLGSLRVDGIAVGPPGPVGRPTGSGFRRIR